ncbi:hypothetical protein [Nocardiopsis valliformis]|uniref:hypothetical protein n=1 Tax=Nocardiopsis valliformis TaxID=239974 RepID=UPI001EF9CA1C|nr:hypothetical protein [Nocardiopsis valliformis]
MHYAKRWLTLILQASSDLTAKCALGKSIAANQDSDRYSSQSMSTRCLLELA